MLILMEYAQMALLVTLINTVLSVRKLNWTSHQEWFKEQSVEVYYQKLYLCQLVGGHFKWINLVRLVGTAHLELTSKSYVLQVPIVMIRMVKM
jgi:hypothetical protein